MWGDAEAVRRDDGMNGIVVARHSVKRRYFGSIGEKYLLQVDGCPIGYLVKAVGFPK